MYIHVYGCVCSFHCECMYRFIQYTHLKLQSMTYNCLSMYTYEQYTLKDYFQICLETIQ